MATSGRLVMQGAGLTFLVLAGTVPRAVGTSASGGAPSRHDRTLTPVGLLHLRPPKFDPQQLAYGYAPVLPTSFPRRAGIHINLHVFLVPFQAIRNYLVRCIGPACLGRRCDLIRPHGRISVVHPCGVHPLRFVKNGLTPSPSIVMICKSPSISIKVLACRTPQRASR